MRDEWLKKHVRFCIHFNNSTLKRYFYAMPVIVIIHNTNKLDRYTGRQIDR